MQSSQHIHKVAYPIIWLTRMLTSFVARMVQIGRTNGQLVPRFPKHDPGTRQADVHDGDNQSDVLRRTHMLYHSVIEHLPAILYMLALDDDERFLYISPRVEMALGFAHREWVEGAERWLHYLMSNSRARALSHLLQTHEFTDAEAIEFRILTRHGRIMWFRDEIVVLRDAAGKPRHLQGFMLDITERKHAEERLRHQSLYDSLTDLPNRVLLMERIQQALQRERSYESNHCAILFLDIDHFKHINESLDHLSGDELLMHIARRLAHILRPQDMLARFGGDEFVIFLDHPTSTETSRTIADQIQQSMAPPFTLGGHDIFITTSIGIACSTAMGYTHAEELIRDASTAVYWAKAHGRACSAVFDPTMHRSAVTRLHLERDLRRALERGEFVMQYQPQIALDSGEIIGVEALIRWQHPERGLIAPADFIPMAEETGLIIPIGEWALREACRQTKVWHSLGAHGLKVAVNLSARQFKHPNIYAVVTQILAEEHLDPQYLELELTESLAMDHVEMTIALMRALKVLGIRIAVDDFGTGYSSLSYLKRFPIDVVKIDRSFVKNSTSDLDDRAIVITIITMARNLRLQAIAEGVETEEQLKLLTEHGCNVAQGYLFSPAIPATNMTTLLETRQMDGLP